MSSDRIWRKVLALDELPEVRVRCRIDVADNERGLAS